MRPGTCQADIQMIAAALGPESSGSTWPRRTVAGDPIAKDARRPLEAPAGRGRVISNIPPFAVHKHTHWFAPSRVQDCRRRQMSGYELREKTHFASQINAESTVQSFSKK